MLRYGYFHDLKSGPKLLIWGGPDDMARLYEALSQVAASEGPQALTDIQGCVAVDDTTVLLETVGEAEGIVRDEVEADVFHWRVDEEDWYAFQELVEPLTHCSSAKPGHQYLESLANGEITVMVSCGEYPDDLKP
jgi:hypothetical protein